MGGRGRQGGSRAKPGNQLVYIYKTHISRCQDAVLYLPTFDVPATEMARAL